MIDRKDSEENWKIQYILKKKNKKLSLNLKKRSMINKIQ